MRYNLRCNDVVISKWDTLQEVLAEVRKLESSGDQKYKSKCYGTTPLSVETVPDDIADVLFRRAQDIAKYHPDFSMTNFLSEVYGILGEEIRKSERYQNLIEDILLRYYK